MLGETLSNEALTRYFQDHPDQTEKLMKLVGTIMESEVPTAFLETLQDAGPRLLVMVVGAGLNLGEMLTITVAKDPEAPTAEERKLAESYVMRAVSFLADPMAFLAAQANAPTMAPATAMAAPHVPGRRDPKAI